MNNITLYHGSNTIIDSPICEFGRENLDFGRGFYLTEHRKQAEDWARKVARNDSVHPPVLNIYSFDREAFIECGRCKVFKEYDREWLDFIVDSRSGKRPWIDYDMIEGGIANDRVIDTINLYMMGLMDANAALGRLAMHQPNNQICLLNQNLLNMYLKYVGYELVARSM